MRSNVLLCRIVCDDLAELRAANVKAIRAARSAAVQAGLADGRGYDMLVVPEVRQYSKLWSNSKLWTC